MYFGGYPLYLIIERPMIALTQWINQVCCLNRSRLVHGQASLRMIIVFGTLALLSGCTNDIDLEAPGEEVPVVYGLLSARDTAHYLRIERAFRTQGGDAETLAQQAGTLYFTDITVLLENQQTGQQFPLQRVDGAEEGYPRQDGPFAQAPNYLYKITDEVINFSGGELVRLLIERNNDVFATAQTTILSPLEPSLNSPFSPINMAYERQVRFAWGHGLNVGIFQVQLIVQIREEISAGQWEDRRLTWMLDEALLPDDDVTRSSITVLGEQFYRFLANTLAGEPPVRRQFMGMALEVIAGGSELAEARQIDQANAGLTAAQFIPEYSNISGGVGVFSSRAQLQRTALRLNGPSLDSLREGQLTQDLNFQ